MSIIEYIAIGIAIVCAMEYYLKSIYLIITCYENVFFGIINLKENPCQIKAISRLFVF